MSELRDRLEALAARGTPRGADAVLNAARGDAQSGAADGEAGFDEGDLPLAGDELPFVTSEPRARRRRFGSFVAAAGIAAMVGVGVLAVTAMFGSGGAGSPEGAVRQLADAINHKDPLAAVDVLVPSEVRSLRDTVHAATQRAADLQIVNDAGQPLAGVDLSVDHLALTTQPLADGYAKVVITSGDLSASTHRAQLSALLQKAMRGSGGDAQGKTDLTQLAQNANLPTFVVVVRQGGRWYVSPAYTAFKYAREINHDPEADFGSAQTAQLGSSTPEGAVSDALHAAQAGNWDRVFALAPPDELPLYDYRAMLAKETAGDQPDFTIDHLATTPSVDGDSGTVSVTASGTFGTDHSPWQLGGSCPASTGGLSSFAQASSSGGTVVSDGSTSSGWCFSGDTGSLLPFSLLTGERDSATTGPISVSVVRENGRWFVSPVTTVLQSLDRSIARLDQRTVYTVLGLAYELPPDGTITLDQPFDVPAPTGLLNSRVYAFDGKAGEKIVGEAGGAAGGKDTAPSAFGQLYTADGNEVGGVEFQPVPLSTGPGSFAFISSATLPKSGSYRLVVDPYFGSNPSVTLTLWDLADAPKALRDAAAANDSQFGSQTCTSSGGLFVGGGESCVSSGVTITPTTVAGTSNTYTYPAPSANASTGTTSPASTSATSTSSP